MKLAVKTLLVSMFFAAGFLPAQSAEVYEIDPGHSTILFNVKHFGVSKVYGRFNEFEGVIHYDPNNPEALSVELTIKAESIDTAHERRDKHLRSPDFFNANQFGTITFKSTKVVQRQPGNYVVTGDLTMVGTTKSIEVQVEEVGAGPHPRGGFLRGFHGTATIHRKDFNMNYGIDGGALGDEVSLIFSFETNRKDS